MNNKNIIRKSNKTILALAVATAIFSSAPSYAGIGHGQGQGNANYTGATTNTGGNVLPPEAEPYGYSLSEMAKVTADFNFTDHSGIFPIAVNGTPIQGLFTTSTNTFDVKEGTLLYVPVFANDNSFPVIGTFPAAGDKSGLDSYFNSHTKLGVVSASIIVDGKVTLLDDDYFVQVSPDPALANGGLQYRTLAAFLTPLKKGKHTVEIDGDIEGDALVSWCATVTSLGYSCVTPWKFSILYKVNVN